MKRWMLFAGVPLALGFVSSGCAPEKLPTNPAPVDFCANAEKDVNETDIDCGGVCASCPTGRSCTENTDCASSLCVPTVYHDEDTIGRCWAADYSGCALVPDEAFPDVSCVGTGLAMCQIASNAEIDDHCAMAPNAPESPRLLCCELTFFEVVDDRNSI